MIKVNDILIQKKDLDELRTNGRTKITSVKTGTMWSIYKIEDDERYWLKPLNEKVLGGKELGIMMFKEYIGEYFRPVCFNTVQSFADLFGTIYDFKEVEEVLEQIGVSIVTSEGDFRSFKDVMEDIIEVFKMK